MSHAHPRPNWPAACSTRFGGATQLTQLSQLVHPTRGWNCGSDFDCLVAAATQAGSGIASQGSSNIAEPDHHHDVCAECRCAARCLPGIPRWIPWMAVPGARLPGRAATTRVEAEPVTESSDPETTPSQDNVE